MKNIFNYIIPAALLTPMLALAQFEGSTGGDGGINTLFAGATDFIDSILIPLLLAVAFLLFVVGVAQFFFVTDDSGDAKKKGKTLMIWGVIAFVVIVSIWGIVLLISGGLGLQDGSLDGIPTTPSI